MVQWYHSPTLLAVHGDPLRLGEKPLQHHHVKIRGRGGAKGMIESGPINLMELENSSQRHTGGAMAAETPNYMKPTASSDARRGQSRSLVSIIGGPTSNFNRDNGSTSPLTRMSSLKSARALTKNRSLNPARENSSSPVYDARRATCTSTLKERKFPAYLTLNHGGTQSVGTSAIRVCPYTYCSLNGYHHAPLPPLKCFLSAKRAQKKKILGCGVKPVGDHGLIPRQNHGMQDDLRSMRIEEDPDFFVENFSEKVEGSDEYPRMGFDTPICHVDSGKESVVNSVVEVGLKCESDTSGMNLETGDCPATLFPGYEHDEFLPGIGMGCDGRSEVQVIHDEFMLTLDQKHDCVGKFPVDQVLQESDLDSRGESNGSMHNLVVAEDSAPVQVRELEQVCGNTIYHNVAEEEASFDNLENELPIQGILDQTGDIEDITLLRTTGKRKKTVQEGDDLGDFNPRGPNFLPLEPDHEAEKVDLRHQEVDEKRDAEEWMVDYALRQAVTKLGPARKRKVALLVEAFEEVMPVAKWERPFGHGSSAFDLGRPIQACR